MYYLRILILHTFFWYTVSKAELHTGTATWYDPGVTACGQTSSSQDMIAAVSGHFWGTTDTNHDPVCNKAIRIFEANGGTNSVTVPVTDKCGTCGEDDLDLSPATFQKFHDLSVGTFPVKWEWVG